MGVQSNVVVLAPFPALAGQQVIHHKTAIVRQVLRIQLERCQVQVDSLKRQRVDIDATIDELTNFIALVKAQTDQEG